jgi:hypothetical protein
MPNYRRAFVPNGCWFFTVSLLERQQTLLVDHIVTLREAVAATRQRYPAWNGGLRFANPPCTLSGVLRRSDVKQIFQLENSRRQNCID